VEMSASKRFMRELHDVDYQAIVLRRDDGATTGQKFDVLPIEFERLWWNSSAGGRTTLTVLSRRCGLAVPLLQIFSI
jgi:hypothetical protein